ncbi:MAG: hypothetical protein ACHRHE_03310 [Tepidisphaerales bacterium]
MQIQGLNRVPCEEKTGFLFSHACQQMAYHRCDVCGKAVCEKHVQWADTAELTAMNMLNPNQPRPVTDNASVCTTCAKRLGRNRSSSVHRYRTQDDLFWYSDLYYPGYGFYGPGYWGHAYISDVSSFGGDSGGGLPPLPHAPTTRPAYDPNDFTDADSLPLEKEDDANFEMDKSGS